MLRNLWRFAAFTLAIALFGLAPPSVRAASLADLIASNGTIVQGDKLFSNFGYTPTGEMPLASGVTVTGIGTGLGTDYIGLRFQGAFSDFFLTAGGSDALITYDVTVTDPNYWITDAHLDSNVSAAAGTGSGTITESFLPVFPPFLTNFSINPGTTQVHDDYTWGSGYKTLHVQKDINLLALAGSVSMSLVDQRYSQSVVPLPATANMGLALIGCLGVFGVWRRLKGAGDVMA